MVLILVATSDVGGALGTSGTLGRRGFSGCACCWLVEFFPQLQRPATIIQSLWMVGGIGSERRGVAFTPSN